MQPPKRSFRSRTHTRQPPFARSAPHASALTPLPTITASKSATDDLPELVVADEPALSRTELLHASEHACLLVLREIEPELVRLDADRVEPALLAEHDRPLRLHELARVGLDRRRVVELRGDRPRLAAEERVARDRLPRLELVAGQLLHASRHLADAVEAEVRLHAVQRAEGQRDLAEVRVARALAHAVDRPLHPGRAGGNSGGGVGGGEAEVVVAMEVHRGAVDPLQRATDEIRDGLGRRDAEGVDDDDLLCAGLDRALVHAPIELEIGACRVDT